MPANTAHATPPAHSTRAPLTLLVMAAGMGSRFGGCKQLRPIGPTGETLLELNLKHAAAAGFTRAVFVIRADFEADFRASVLQRIETLNATLPAPITCTLAYQALEALPATLAPAQQATLLNARTKPWGTAHAVWCARTELTSGPFAAINADDYYGAHAFQQLANFFQNPAHANNTHTEKNTQQHTHPNYALVTYQLGQTLSESGSVSRGVCTVNGGMLETITETHGLEASNLTQHSCTPTTPVSMNLWGFTPTFLNTLETYLHDFFTQILRASNEVTSKETPSTQPQSEAYLPSAVTTAMQTSSAHVHALPTHEKWYGLTYKADIPAVKAALANE